MKADQLEKSTTSFIYSAFQYCTSAIVILDLQGRITKVNKTFTGLFGYSRSEIAGKHLSFIRSSKNYSDIYQQMWRATREQGEWKGELINEDRSGNEIPTLLSISSIFQKGKRISYMAIIIDMRQLNTKNKPVFKEDDFSHSLVENAGCLIFAMDRDARITLFNAKCEQVTAYARDEVLGQSWIDTFLPDDIKIPTQNFLEKAFLETKSVTYESAIKTKNNGLRQISWNCTTLYDEDHTITGMLSLGLDITQQQELKNKVIRTERLAAIGKMAAKVAHEIRNPLSSISLNAELLLDEILVPENVDPNESKALLHAIIKEVDRLANLTDEYLQFSRLPKCNEEEKEISKIIESVIELIQMKAVSKGIQIQTSCPESIPPIILDQAQIRRVMLNICNNAIEAMPHGGNLTLECSAPGKVLQLVIKDTGVGIPKHEYDHIFDAFFTRKEQGTGLGLTISRQIVEEHGGTITCENNLPLGTTFRINLPMKKNHTLKR